METGELDWLRHRVSYWADEFDWRAWERRLNALNHFIWEGIHFVYQRAASGRGVPIILTHGWPSSFLDYVGMLPMLENFDVGVPSLPGYAFSPRPPKVGINYRYVSERWHQLMSELGYSRYGAGGYDFGAGVTTILALDHPDRANTPCSCVQLAHSRFRYNTKTPGSESPRLVTESPWCE